MVEQPVPLVLPRLQTRDDEKPGPRIRHEYPRRGRHRGVSGAGGRSAAPQRSRSSASVMFIPRFSSISDSGPTGFDLIRGHRRGSARGGVGPLTVAPNDSCAHCPRADAVGRGRPLPTARYAEVEKRFPPPFVQELTPDQVIELGCGGPGIELSRAESRHPADGHRPIQHVEPSSPRRDHRRSPILRAPGRGPGRRLLRTFSGRAGFVGTSLRRRPPPARRRPEWCGSAWRPIEVLRA
jgi:hypothetical protein